MPGRLESLQVSHPGHLEYVIRLFHWYGLVMEMTWRARLSLHQARVPRWWGGQQETVNSPGQNRAAAGRALLRGGIAPASDVPSFAPPASRRAHGLRVRPDR